MFTLRFIDYSILFNFGAGLKEIVLLAFIFIASPVRGFLPVLALRFLTEKVPNPGYTNRLSFFKDLDNTSNMQSASSSVSLLLRVIPFAPFCTASTNSALFFQYLRLSFVNTKRKCHLVFTLP